MSRILVVDDDAAFQESVAALLQAKGYDVLFASNGTEAYEAAKREKPDLMLLDVMMTTDSEGFEVARKIHEDPDTHRIPIVLVTGIRKAKSLPFSFEPDEDWLPVKAVLEKPVKPEFLYRAVEEALK